MKRAIFLDRDGVLNALVRYSDAPPESPRVAADLHLLPGVALACRQLRQAGWLLVLVSNQPNAAKGKSTLAELGEVHTALVAQLGAQGAWLDGAFYCHHHPDGVVAAWTGPCPCRKPQPGLLLRAAAQHDLDLGQCWLVGDQDTDTQAGRAAGCLTASVQQPDSAHKRGHLPADVACADLAGFARGLLSGTLQAAEEPSRMPPLRIQIYSDGADIAEMLAARASGQVQGFTTNPTLMRKAGLTDYLAFARAALAAIPDLPISLEVFADDFDEMERQARLLAALGANVFVKIPITNTLGDSAVPLVRRLSADGIQLNVTAILTLVQVEAVAAALNPQVPAIVSVFAGRIADTGVDPVPIMTQSLGLLSGLPRAQLLWASPREVLNVVQADQCGCHIITITPDLQKKLVLVGKSLEAMSLDTVQMFRRDALAAGYRL